MGRVETLPGIEFKLSSILRDCGIENIQEVNFDEIAEKDIFHFNITNEIGESIGKAGYEQSQVYRELMPHVLRCANERKFALYGCGKDIRLRGVYANRESESAWEGFVVRYGDFISLSVERDALKEEGSLEIRIPRLKEALQKSPWKDLHLIGSIGASFRDEQIDEIKKLAERLME